MCDDSIFEPEQKHDHTLLRFRNPEGAPFAYFRVPEAFHNTSEPVRIEVVVYADKPAELWIEYDSRDESVRVADNPPGAFKVCLPGSGHQEGKLYRASFDIPDCQFCRRVNLADFRLVAKAKTGAPLLLKELSLSSPRQQLAALDIESTINDYRDFFVDATLCAEESRRVAQITRMRILLKEVIRIFELEGIDYWLDRGSLLGAYRGGAIIAGDEDIDLRVLHSQWPDIRDALERDLPPTLKVVVLHGDKVVHPADQNHAHPWFECEDGVCYVAHQEGHSGSQYFHTATALCIVPAHLEWFDKPNLDLYCVRLNQHHCCLAGEAFSPWLDDGKVYHCLPARRPQTQVSPENLVYPLDSLNFEGMACNVPGRYEDYLRRIFGYLGENAIRNPATGFWEPAGHQPQQSDR